MKLSEAIKTEQEIIDWWFELVNYSERMEFYDLVKAIGESKSKQEEDRIIQDEVRRYSYHKWILTNHL